MKSKALLAFSIFLIAAKCYSQGNPSYKSIIDKRLIGKAFVRVIEDDSLWITYMGKIYNNVDKADNYIVKEFQKIKAASTWHGHSKVYIFKSDKKHFARFDVGMPDNLPFKFTDDYLYFRYEENGIEKIQKIKITFPLPQFFCTKANGCEEIEIE